MTRKRILVLDGHPAERSLSQLFASTYATAARAAGHEVRVQHLSAMEFDTDFGGGGYTHSKPLEPELKAVADDLAWCNHFVVIAPMWWGGLPAKLKGLFDRVLLPGFAFNTRETNAVGMPKPMLQGRSARVIFTSDTPGWLFRLMYGRALVRQTRGQILHFIGMKPARFTWFSAATEAKEDRVAGWAGRVARLGRAAA